VKENKGMKIKIVYKPYLRELILQLGIFGLLVGFWYITRIGSYWYWAFAAILIWYMASKYLEERKEE